MIALTRSTRRLIVLGVLAALSGTGQAVVSATDAAATIIQPAPARPPQDIAEATEWFRMDLGLRSDRSFVLDVATDPSASRADYGYPLLPEEVAYLERREVARAQLDATQDHLSGLSRTVAGLYLDNQAPRAAGIDLTLVVAFTDNAESHRAELTRLLPKGVALALKTAKYSKAELDSIVEDVIADREWHKSLGVDVYVAGTDERRDRVLLGISEPNESAAAALASRYGADRIYVYVSAKPELDACIRTNCPPPWVAGLKIDSTSNPATGNHCTSGFSVKSASGNWFQLTAGHCPSNRWYHNGTLMGVTPSGVNKFSNNSPADIQAFDIAQANWSNTLLTGSKTCNPCLFRTMASRQVAGADMLNDTICASGAYTGSNCGVLKIKDASYFYADYGITLTHQRTASYMRTGGDSGGPVFSGTMAIGSHVNFQPDTGWAVYSHIYNIESSLGMSMCFSGC